MDTEKWTRTLGGLYQAHKAECHCEEKESDEDPLLRNALTG